jgi:hypothetical protein
LVAARVVHASPKRLGGGPKEAGRCGCGTTKLQQTHYKEYPDVSEGRAVAYLLERCDAVDKRVAAKFAKRTRAAAEEAEVVAVAPQEDNAMRSLAREARCAGRRSKRARYLGLLDDVQAADIVRDGGEADATLVDLCTM